MEINKDRSIEHQNVPEAHRGLHDFLYHSDDEHAANGVATTPADVTSISVEALPLETWRSRVNGKVAGVYAVLDTAGHTQYVGYSRNILLALNAHLALQGPETCAYVRVQAFKYPQRDAMEALRDAWLAKLDSVPPGNGEASEQWASTLGEAGAAMSIEERHAYEEKKLKLRKAMADTTLLSEPQSQKQPSGIDDAGVEGSDWSSLIAEQNQATSS